jgi:hypothetical protein
MLDNAAQLPTMMMSIFKILTCVKYLLNMKIAGLVPEGAISCPLRPLPPLLTYS